jgi:hypothetical protein
MPATFLFTDFNGTDGTDAALTSLVYRLNNKQYRIPGDTAEPNREAAVEALAGAEQAALADMIATFVVTPEAIAYFNALQQALRDVSNNNSANIGGVFPNMRTLLQADAGLYNRYLNLLRVGKGISQATFQATPTTGEQRDAFDVAWNYANGGMIQMIAGVLFG